MKDKTKKNPSSDGKPFINKNIVLTGIILLLNYFIFISTLKDLSFRSQDLLLLSYQKIGFGSRALLGTLLTAFGIDRDNVNVFLYIIYFLIFALFFLFTVRILHRETPKKIGKTAESVRNLPVIMCLCPFFLYGFSCSFFGSISAVFVLLTIICFLLAQNQKAVYAIPFVCLFAILSDHVFALLYLPAICLYLKYKSNQKNGKVFRKAFSLTIGISIPAFILMIILSFRNDFPVYFYGNRGDQLYGSKFKVIGDFLQTYNSTLSNEAIRFVFALPVIVFLAYLWIKCIKVQKNNNFFSFCIAHLATVFVPLVFFKGFGSWLPAVMSAQIMLAMGLIYENDANFLTFAGKTVISLNSRRLILPCCFMAFYFYIIEILPLLNKII